MRLEYTIHVMNFYFTEISTSHLKCIKQRKNDERLLMRHEIGAAEPTDLLIQAFEERESNSNYTS